MGTAVSLAGVFGTKLFDTVEDKSFDKSCLAAQ